MAAVHISNSLSSSGLPNAPFANKSKVIATLDFSSDWPETHQQSSTNGLKRKCIDVLPLSDSAKHFCGNERDKENVGSRGRSPRGQTEDDYTDSKLEDEAADDVSQCSADVDVSNNGTHQFFEEDSSDLRTQHLFIKSITAELNKNYYDFISLDYQEFNNNVRPKLFKQSNLVNVSCPNKYKIASIREVDQPLWPNQTPFISQCNASKAVNTVTKSNSKSLAGVSFNATVHSTSRSKKAPSRSELSELLRRAAIPSLTVNKYISTRDCVKFHACHQIVAEPSTFSKPSSRCNLVPLHAYGIMSSNKMLIKNHFHPHNYILCISDGNSTENNTFKLSVTNNVSHGFRKEIGRGLNRYRLVKSNNILYRSKLPVTTFNLSSKNSVNCSSKGQNPSEEGRIVLRNPHRDLAEFLMAQDSLHKLHESIARARKLCVQAQHSKALNIDSLTLNYLHLHTVFKRTLEHLKRQWFKQKLEDKRNQEENASSNV